MPDGGGIADATVLVRNGETLGEYSTDYQAARETTEDGWLSSQGMTVTNCIGVNGTPRDN